MLHNTMLKVKPTIELEFKATTECYCMKDENSGLNVVFFKVYTGFF